MDEKVVFACEEHVEIAIDEVLNESENAPKVEKVQGEKCSFCDREATYKVFG